MPRVDGSTMSAIGSADPAIASTAATWMTPTAPAKAASYAPSSSSSAEKRRTGPPSSSRNLFFASSLFRTHA